MDIQPLDLRFRGVPRAICAYLVKGPGGHLLVDVGPMSTLETLIARLAERELEPGDIPDVLLTHIHLDHAGAAGWWAAQGARIHVHHRGAPHLVDPSRLLASAARIYGDELEELWGPVLPAPASQVRPLLDRASVWASGLHLLALESPGHARHHLAYRVRGCLFTGDAVGVRIAGSTLIGLPAPPPEFDREAWHLTLDVLAIEAAGMRALYPTHFGPVYDVSDHLARFRALLDDAVDFVRARLEAGDDRDSLIARYTAWNAQRAAEASAAAEVRRAHELANPPAMSVDGIVRYCRQQAAAAC
jgi:glyoxylase-like metal-dependent hydrolase (beta-lactamase superfamily II)